MSRGHPWTLIIATRPASAGSDSLGRADARGKSMSVDYSIGVLGVGDGATHSHPTLSQRERGGAPTPNTQHPILWEAMSAYVSGHPLIQHKLHLLRSRAAEPKKFRELVRE